MELKVLKLTTLKIKMIDFTTSTNTVKAEAKNWGAKYNFGQITVGYANKKYKMQLATHS